MKIADHDENCWSFPTVDRDWFSLFHNFNYSIFRKRREL